MSFPLISSLLHMEGSQAPLGNNFAKDARLLRELENILAAGSAANVLTLLLSNIPDLLYFYTVLPISQDMANVSVLSRLQQRLPTFMVRIERHRVVLH